MICKRCEVEKPTAEFHRDKNRKSGYKPYCRDCCNAYGKSHYAINKETILAKRAAFHKENPELRPMWEKRWRESNRDKVNAQAARYRASKLNATPNWLTEEHHKDIEQFYWLAKDLCAVTGERYEVDHIVPLQGENVSGLHVPWNLQVLPRDINASKGNTTCPH